MGLCLADSLLCTGGKLCPLDLMVRFVAWWNCGYNNAFGNDPTNTRKHSVGLGGNISQSLGTFKHDGEPYATVGDCLVSGTFIQATRFLHIHAKT